MTLLTSGDWHVDCERILTFDIFEYMCKRFPRLKDTTIEVNQVDLSDDNAFGFKTLAHELIHVRQTLEGLHDNEMREQEAYIWEDILSKDFWDTYQSGTFFSTAWTKPAILKV